MRWTTVGWVAVAAWLGHAAWTSDAWTLYRAENRVTSAQEAFDRAVVRARRDLELGVREECVLVGGDRYRPDREECGIVEPRSREEHQAALLYLEQQVKVAKTEVARLRAARRH